MGDDLLFKLCAAGAILGVGLGGGLLARVCAAGPRSAQLFSLGNAFAGGVFLGAGLIHMLPDARAGFSQLLGSHDYPWFAVAAAAGFLVILFLERVCAGQTGHTHVAPGTDMPERLLYPYVLMLVLSLHSVITGIALGTETTIAQAVVILIAVLAHKGTAAFALGVSMLRAHLPPGRFARMIAMFALMTPAGIVLGCGAMRILSGRTEQAFEALFDALAAGTFLYVAVVDILGEEFAHHVDRWLKFLLVLLGLGLMALVAIWT